ncbi:13121_t:CDS:2, partial [Gigaspora margarita]
IAAFRASDKDIEDKPCSGHSREATTPEVIAKVKELVSDNSHIITRGLLNLVDISHERVNYILNEELNMKKICTKWVTKYGYIFFTVSSKEDNKQWVKSEENRPQIVRTAKYSKKRMFCIFFAADSIVASKVVPEGTTINSRFYVNNILPEVFNNFMKKRDRYTVRDVLLHHNNAMPHGTKIVTNYLKKQRVKLVPYPPY